MKIKIESAILKKENITFGGVEMKNVLKKILILLVVVMAIGAVLLARSMGLEQPEFGGIKKLATSFSAFINEISLKAKAEESISDSYETFIGTFESSTLVIISGDSWTTEVTVSGDKYILEKTYAQKLDLTNNEEKYLNQRVIISLYDDGEVILLETLESVLNGTSTITTDPECVVYNLPLNYRNGKFSDKKVEINGAIMNNLARHVNFLDSEFIRDCGILFLKDIQITLTSNNTDILYFKEGLLSPKSDHTVVELGGGMAVGQNELFSQTAYINTKWDFPDDCESYSFDISCQITGKVNGRNVIKTTTIPVNFKNLDYNTHLTDQSKWRKQTLTELLKQMQTKVNICPVLSEAGKVAITSTISAILLNKEIQNIDDELEMLETVYDFECYFYDLKYATVKEAGKLYLEAIIDECHTASDELKDSMSNLLGTLRNSKAFNDYIYWYFNVYQTEIGNQKMIKTHCPIDVKVVEEDGKQVVSVVNDEILLSEDGTSVFVFDGKKTLFLPTDINHTIEIVATDNGTMNYSVCEYTTDGHERTVEYNNVELIDGISFTSQISKSVLPDADSYNLVSSTGDVIENDFDSHSEDAYSKGYCGDGVKWMFNKNTGVLKIKGFGEVDFGSFAPWYGYRDYIKSVEISYGITGIARDAFVDCNSLVNVYFMGGVADWCAIVFDGWLSNPMCYADNLYINGQFVSGEFIIPDSVISIGHYAFYNCTSLTSITIPDNITNIGNYSFYNCTSLIGIALPDSVISIGDNAFNKCENLASIIIPDGVTSIGNNAFKGCTKLENVTIGNGVTSLNGFYFKNNTNLKSIIIGNKVTKISDNMFSGCSNLASITIPDSVTSIGYSVFYNCTSLADIYYVGDVAGWCSINFAGLVSNPMYYAENLYINEILLTDLVIPDSVTSICNYVFYNCTGLIGITISDSVTSIGDSAFSGCTGLASITIPNSVTSIGDYAFNDCSNLTSVYYEGNIADWCGIKFVGLSSNPIYYANNLYVNGTLLKDLVIPDSVTNISDCAFYNYKSLTSITIPDSVTSIGHYAFKDCSNLEKVTIGNGVMSLNGFYFDNNTNLKCITIGNSVTKIDDDMFWGCSSLTSITIPDSVVSIGKNAFRDCTMLEKVTISNSVTSIGYYAFEGCYKLENVTIGNGVTSLNGFYFENNTNLKCITIGNSVTKISDDMFSGCSNLSSVTLGNSVASIGHYAFYNCTSLTNITIPDNVTSIGNCVFYNCTGLISVTIGNSLTSIGSSMFLGCISLTSVTIGNSVTSIGDSAFSGCSELTDIYYTGDVAGWCSINFAGLVSNPMYYADNLYINGILLTDLVIPDSVTSIGNFVFYNCTDLIDITISDSVTSIGASAFNKCINLKNVTIPDSVTRIGGNAFNGCDGLENVIIGNGVTSLNGFYFSGNKNLKKIIIGNSVSSIGSSAFSGCTGLDSITIPDSVTSIGDNAFNKCVNLTSITIGNSVKSISSFAFSGCTELVDIFYTGDIAGWCSISFGSLSSNPMYYADNFYIDGNIVSGELIIPDNITSISSYSFSNCTSITSIIIPNNVASIGDYAFYNCTGFTGIIIPDSITSIGGYAFANCDKLKHIHISANVSAIGERFLYSSPAYICSETENCYAKEYADTNGIEFRICNGHDSSNPEHTHSYSTSITTPATCTNDGIKTYTCSCGDSYTESIPTTGHTKGSWVISIEPSCTIEGEKVANCTVCGVICENDVVPANGHMLGEWETVLNATCIENGEKIKKCVVCGETVATETINAKVHTPGEWIETTAPTETITGVETQYCVVCNASIATRETGTLEHIHSYTLTSATEPTCTAEGTNVFACRCGESYTETVIATGHTSGSWEPVLEPTTETEGKKIKKCTICGTTLSEEAIAKLPRKEPIKDKAVVKSPSTSSISYGDSIVLHVDASKIPEGGRVEWTASNGNFSYKAYDETCIISPEKSGDTTFTATIYDAEDNPVSTDEQTMTSKAGFFDKIIAFFKKLFGLTKTIPAVFKGII